MNPLSHTVTVPRALHWLLALGLGAGAIWTIKQGNGGVTVNDYPDGGAAAPVVSALNLTSHLGGVLDRTAAGAL